MRHVICISCHVKPAFDIARARWAEEPAPKLQLSGLVHLCPFIILNLLDLAQSDQLHLKNPRVNQFLPLYRQSPLLSTMPKAAASPAPPVPGDASAPSTNVAKHRSGPNAGTRVFLTLYNLVSAVLWSVVLERTLVLYFLRGPWKVFFGVGSFVTVTQTLAVCEIIFSLTGRFCNMKRGGNGQ